MNWIGEIHRKRREGICSTNYNIRNDAVDIKVEQVEMYERKGTIDEPNRSVFRP